MLTHVFGNYKEMSKDIWPTNKGMVGVDGPDWWKTRSVMNKYTGRPGYSESCLPGLEEIADDFVKLCTDHILDENNDTPDNFIDTLFAWNIESSFYVHFKYRLGNLTGEGIKDKSNDTNGIMDALNIVMLELTKLMLGNFWTKFPNLSPSFKRFDAAWRDFVSIVRKHYKIKEEELANMTAEDRSGDNGLLANILQECRGNSEMENMPLSVVLESLVAGHPTTSIMVSYFLYDLAMRPDKQQRVYEEIMKEIGDKPITPKGLKKLNFLGLAPRSRRDSVLLFWEFLGRFRLQL